MSRLEDIKKTKYTFLETSNTDLKGDLAWLINQVEQLEKEKKALVKIVNHHQDKQKEAENLNEPYRHANKRYKQALEDLKSHAYQCKEFGRDVLTHEIVGRVDQALEGSE